LNNSKLINVLKTLSREELKKFGDFVKSPYFNKNTNVIMLFTHLSKYSTDYSSSWLNKENVYNEIFPGKSYNNKVLKNLMTELLKLEEKFLQAENWGKDTSLKNNSLLQELLNRKQYSMFLNKAKAAEDTLAKLGINEQYYYDRIQIDILKQAFELRRIPSSEKFDQTVGLRVEDNLFAYFLITYFKLNCNMLTRKLSFDIKTDPGFIENVIDYIRRGDFRNKPIIMIYYYMYMLYLKSDNEKCFHELIKLIKTYGKLLSKQEQNNIYVPLIAFCMRMINNGYINYKIILFEICKDVVSNGIYYLQDGLIDPVIYKIIIKAGVWAKEFEWSFNYMEKNKDNLNPEYRSDTYHYCHSYFNFMKGEYEKSLEHLSAVRYQNVVDKADVNRLLMKIYYEMGLTEELFSLTETYKHFLRNDKLLSAEAKTRINNFTKFLISAYKLKTTGQSNYDVQIIKKQLEQKEAHEKDWLFEKLKELKK